MKALVAICLLGLLAVSAYAEVSDEVAQTKWADFLAKYDKTYDSENEYGTRFKIFRDNLNRNEELNKLEGNEVFGVTKFSDLSPEEFRRMYLMRNPERWFPSDFSRAPEADEQGPLDLPSSYNWVDQGATTPVYNQGQCGSCWAFSATENIESISFLAGNSLTSLSMQQIVSCDKYDDGCGGGEPMTAYYYVKSAGGLESFSDYPYQSGGGNSGQCSFNSGDIVQNIAGWEYVTKTRNETQMMAYSYSKGPLSICVDASTWSSYQGGVMTPNSCSTALDHCVQLVGWGSGQDGTDYWIVRNSWGTDWGLNGYIWLARDQDTCGVAQEVTSSLVNKN